MSVPRVSIVMPVFNGAKYVAQAIDSVLSQTFRDFELVVIDDGSTDNSAAIVAQYKDPRIVFVSNAQNSGLANVRNKGVALARGEYLAWLDCDDVSLPMRLEKQVRHLDRHANIGLCGTWVKTLGGQHEDVWKYPTAPGFLRARMIFDDPVATSSVMIRMSCLRQEPVAFDLAFPPAEDYELWERISRRCDIANIPEVLTLYRLHPEQISLVRSETQKRSIRAIQNRLLEQLRLTPSTEEMELHLDIGVRWNFSPNRERIEATERWLLKLEKANRTHCIFPEIAFRHVLAERWYFAAVAAANQGLAVWMDYHRSELSRWTDRRYWRLARLLLKCISHGVR